jgi:hypothetical protein
MLNVSVAPCLSASVSTQMKPDLRAKLVCDDKMLFTQCACHVFADELATKLSSRGFALNRLADLNRTAAQMQALHVFMSKDGIMIDVEGEQKVDEYLESCRQFRRDHDGPVPDFAVLECSREELFETVPMAGDDERGVRNKWHHLIDSDFVSECRRRAQARLAASPELYGLCLPDGPANGSQPIRFETNSKSSAAGARR